MLIASAYRYCYHGAALSVVLQCELKNEIEEQYIALQVGLVT